MEKIGEKFIDGKLINLDKENMGNLKNYARNMQKKEIELKNNLNDYINIMINI